MVHGWSELAPLSEPERVPSAVASGLAIPEDPHRTPAETLAEQLRSKQLLLVVDNCEHVLATCADLLVGLLRAAPGCACSRQVGRRWACRARSSSRCRRLPIPDEPTDVSLLPSFSAVQLFVERARAVRPDFELTRPTPRRWRRSSGAWTASRWPSSWLRPGSRCYPPSRYPAACRTASASCPGAQDRTASPANPSGGDGLELRPARRGGATPVAAPVGVHGQLHLGGCRGGLRPRRHRGSGRPRRPGAGSSTSPSWWLSRDLRIATGSWRPSASTAESGWRKPARARPPAPPIGIGAPQWWKPLPTRSAVVASRHAGWSCWNSSTTTCTLRWNGPGAAVRPSSLQIAVNAAWFWYLHGHWDEARSIPGAEHRRGGHRAGSSRPAGPPGPASSPGDAGTWTKPRNMRSSEPAGADRHR